MLSANMWAMFDYIQKAENNTQRRLTTYTRFLKCLSANWFFWKVSSFSEYCNLYLNGECIQKIANMAYMSGQQCAAGAGIQHKY